MVLPLLTIPEIDARIERLADEHSAMANALVGLEEHPCLELLDAITLMGSTKECWSRARRILSTVWVEFDAQRSVLEKARAARGHRSVFRAADVAGLTELLTGRGVTLPVETGTHPPGSATGFDRGGSTITVHDLTGSMKAHCAEVSDVLVAVDAVWTTLPPRIQRCRETLSSAEAVAMDLGLRGNDESAEAVAATLGALHSLSAVVHSDPLSLWASGAVDDAAVVALEREADRLHRDLEALADLRDRAQERLDRATTRLGAVADVLRRGHQEREAVVERLGEWTVPPVPNMTETLRQAVLTVDAFRRAGRWRELSWALPELESELEVRLGRAEVLLGEIRHPLSKRAELLGRLGAYRAKARRLGRAEDVELEEQYRQARAVLRRRPCDLSQAAAVVAAYQCAVNVPPAHGLGEVEPAVANASSGDAA